MFNELIPDEDDELQEEIVNQINMGGYGGGTEDINDDVEVCK